MRDRMNDDSEQATDDHAAAEPTRVRYDWLSTPPSTAVVETVGDVTGRDPTALQPLYDVIDPDALDTLVRSSGGNGENQYTSVSFGFADHRVTVRSTGELIVRAAQEHR